MSEVMRVQQQQWTEKKRRRDNEEEKSHQLGRANEKGRDRPTEGDKQAVRGI